MAVAGDGDRARAVDKDGAAIAAGAAAAAETRERNDERRHRDGNRDADAVAAAAAVAAVRYCGNAGVGGVDVGGATRVIDRGAGAAGAPIATIAIHEIGRSVAARAAGAVQRNRPGIDREAVD